MIVAILDWGFDWEHDDLGPGTDGYENIYLNDQDTWTIWDEPNSGDESDNDENGYIDDWKGWGEMHDVNHYPVFYQGNDVRNYDYDWLLEYCQYDEPLAKAFWMHGTFLSGIIGAKTNNGYGISGIAGGWHDKGVSMLFYKLGVTGEEGALTSDVAWGIEYAMYKLPHEHKAKIIELALQTLENSFITNALQDAYNNGAFIVAAAGNHGEGSDFSVSYPANLDFVFAVGATTDQDLRKSNSNYGDELDIGAPGENIFGLVPQTNSYNGFELIEGGNTSAASAMVAGTAALMCSVNPDLTNQAIADTLKAAADKGTYYTYDENGHNDEIGHGRLNAYKAVCKAGQSAPILEIEADETWDYSRSFLRSVHVKSGVTLTINADIQFGPEAALVIESGGTLVVNNSTLTNMKCCDHENTSWPGIEVWGYPNAQQFKYPLLPYPQGVIILNGATIENAVTAINLWKPDDYTMTGGIVEAYNSTFKNNVMSAHALYYRNFNPLYPTQELDYYGIFTNCAFIIDQYYLGDMTFNKHVDLCHVRGLQFNGCTFSLNHEASNISEWSDGIAAYNAGFYVRPYCPSHTIPCVDADSCRFSGFYRGIGSFTSDLQPHPTFIHSARFDDNAIGVYLSSTNYAIVLGNYFEVGYDEGTTGHCGFANGFGIDVNLANGFCIENNKLRKNFSAPTGIYAGIRVQNCPSDYDIIYKNELDGLSYGNYAEGTNRSIPTDDKKGIEYQCNNNSHNGIDFIVQFIGTDTTGAMIRGWQGDKDLASGNIFTRYTSSVLHFSNRGFNTINYYYCYPCTDEEPVHIFSWEPEYFEKEISNENNCPDHYGGGGHIRLTYGERLEEEESFAQNLADYYSVKALYESLIDGGNTESELSDIESAESDDMWALRTQLLGHSPHLSQEVLRAMADRTDVFPDEVLLEILSANPDELNRDTLISYLEQKEDPLPQYMIDILRQAVSGITYKTILEDEMAQYHGAKTQAVQDIVRSILFDTAINISDYRNWLDNLDNMVADRQIIASYLSENDTSNAIALLNLLPSLYNLEGESLADYNNYKSMVELQIQWIAESKNISELDSMDITLLESLAEDSTTIAGNMARNILTYACDHYFCNCLEMQDSAYLKNDFIPKTQPMPVNEILKISAEPNPARTYVAFNYELLNEISTGQILISDLNGKRIWQIQVYGKQGQKVWNTTEIKAGVYYYNLLSDGFSKAGKIVIY